MLYERVCVAGVTHASACVCYHKRFSVWCERVSWFDFIASTRSAQCAAQRCLQRGLLCNRIHSHVDELLRWHSNPGTLTAERAPAVLWLIEMRLCALVFRSDSYGIVCGFQKVVHVPGLGLCRLCAAPSPCLLVCMFAVLVLRLCFRLWRLMVACARCVSVALASVSVAQAPDTVREPHR
jgi:hypothetical protein